MSPWDPTVRTATPGDSLCQCDSVRKSLSPLDLLVYRGRNTEIQSQQGFPRRRRNVFPDRPPASLVVPPPCQEFSSMTSLDQLRVGQRASIKGVEGSDALGQRLLEMGLMEGEE